MSAVLAAALALLAPGDLTVLGQNSFNDALWLMDRASVSRNGNRVAYDNVTVFAPGASTRHGKPVAYVVSRTIIDCTLNRVSYGSTEFFDEAGRVFDTADSRDFYDLYGTHAVAAEGLCHDRWPAAEPLISRADLLAAGRARLARR